MEWIVLLVISLIVLAWRINREMSSIQPPTNPFISNKQEELSNSEAYEDMDFPLSDSLGGGFNSSFSDHGEGFIDIYTDPSYCHLPGNIYYHMCYNEDLSGSNWDNWSS
ncbi:hypothetical protein [Thermocrinis sp.]